MKIDIFKFLPWNIFVYFFDPCIVIKTFNVLASCDDSGMTITHEDAFFSFEDGPVEDSSKKLWYNSQDWRSNTEFKYQMDK